MLFRSNGEKIDIIEWKENPLELIANALKPAAVFKVEILDEEKRKARAIVEDDQLSLAIGKSGLNVRLASKLANWNIDVVKKSEVEINLLDKLLAEKKTLSESADATATEAPEVKEEKVEVKKIKVNDAASELGMDVADILKKLEELGHKAKSASSNIDYDVYLLVKESIA